MHITPDSIIFFSWHGVHLNATIVYTWIVMGIIVTVSYFVTRKIDIEGNGSRWQSALEALIAMVRSEAKGMLGSSVDRYLPFLGTLFIFISISNILAPVPLYHPPTGSLSTTVALSLCVFFAAPYYGIRAQGFWGYLKTYAYPMPLMIPFNIIGDLSRTVAMAVRLFGNILSGTMVGGIVISIVPFFLPIVFTLLELLIGQIQAYIFTILAAVVLSAALETGEEVQKLSTEVEHG